MASLGSLTAFITADNSGLLNGARQSAAAVEKMSTNIAASLNRAGSSISNFGKSLTVGLTLPIAAAGASIIKLASDAEEAGSKFNTVFKDVGTQASAASKELSKSFGLSSVEAQKLLGNTGDLLSGFGFTGEAALDLSVKTNQLAVDLASFTNVEGGAERASAALTKALLGERESAKELGIAILEADVKQRVAQLSARGLTFATERQAKAYATLELATEQSKNAIGDFARTQNSVANQSRILRARVTDLAVSLGQMLLPLANKIIGTVIEWVTAFQSLDNQTKANIIVLAGLVAAIGPVVFITGKLISLVGVVVAGFGAIAAVVGFLLSPVGLLVAGFAVLVAWLVKTGKAAEVVGKVWIGLRTTLALVMSGIATVLSTLTFAFQSFLKGIQLVSNAIGIDLPEGFTNFTSSLDSVQERLDGFAMGQAETAATMSMSWGNAWGAFKTDMESALLFAEAFLMEKGVTIKELLDEITGGLQIGGAEGEEGEGGEEAKTGPGSAQEQAILDKSITAWQKWIDDQRDFSEVWRKTWSQTAVNVANSFSKGFADMIVSGRSFRSVIVSLAQSTASDLIAQAVKSAITHIAIKQTETAANAAASAPNPYLIPLYVGIGLALFASAVGSPGGGGGGGGGGGTAPTTAAASAPQSETLAFTQITGPSLGRDEQGDGGTEEQNVPDVVIAIDGEVLAKAVIKQTKDGMGDGADTLALATE